MPTAKTFPGEQDAQARASEPRKLRRFRILYATAFVGWLLLTLAALGFVIVKSRDAVEADFHRYAQKTGAELHDKLRANDTVLAGFASLLGALDASDRDSARQYASLMLERFPHIYMIEIVRRVEHEHREAFERRMKSTWSPDFRISSFDYVTTRAWQPVADKPAYYPLVFLWPELPDALPVLGLDIESVPHQRTALMQAEVGGQTASSVPFRLVEGDLAYVMLRAAPNRPARRSARSEQVFGGPLQGMLVIKASALQPAKPDRLATHRLRSLHGGSTEGLPLYVIPATEAASPLETMWLPSMRIDLREVGTSQPVQLAIERQMRFSDINDDWLKLAGLFSLLSFSLLAVYLRKRRQEFEHARELAARAEYLALHDLLTGLPNRSLLVDRVRRALATWRRHGTGFALLFLDLDRFKDLNDRFGHDVGDRLLDAVAGRLQAAVRESDTVARYGGDEFVVLISDIVGRDDALAVSRKLLQVVAHPIELGRTTVRLTTSIGISVCPDDGDDFDTLLSNADVAMYRVKTSGRNSVAGSERGQPPALCRSVSFD